MHKSPNPGPTPAARLDVCAGGANVLSALLLVICCIGGQVAAQTTPPKPASAGQSSTPDLKSATQSLDLSDEVVHDVLDNFQRGMESHSLDRVMVVVDPDNMKDYASFRDQMAAFFRLHDSIKFRYQLLQVTADKDAGFVTADVEMDADPADILPTERRRTTQMRFQLKRLGTVWKVIGLTPMDFFTQ